MAMELTYLHASAAADSGVAIVFAIEQETSGLDCLGGSGRGGRVLKLKLRLLEAEVGLCGTGDKTDLERESDGNLSYG